MDEQDDTGKFEIRMGKQTGVEQTEMPLRLLILGDFDPEASDVKDWPGPSRLLNVNPRNFRHVMQQLSLNISLDVPNHTSVRPKELSLKLDFTEMKSFTPMGIIRQVDELAYLVEARKLLVQTQARKITLEEFNKSIQQLGIEPEWVEKLGQIFSKSETKPELSSEPSKNIPKPKTDSAEGTSALDSLLAQIDLSKDETEPTQSSSPIDGLIRAVTQPKRNEKRADKSAVDMAIGEIDRVIGDQLNEILHHDKFQKIESLWRGLKFLVDRTDFRENICIEILSVCKDALRDAIYHQVLMPEHREDSETPLSVMIADYEFGRIPADLELLGDISEMAASIQVPFISSVGAAFFGVQKEMELADLPMLRPYLKEPAYAEWNILRENEDAKYMALVIPKFLLRLPYGPNGNRVKLPGYVERAESAEDYLWGNGVFAVASSLVRSFAANGWCTQITGLRGGGMIENLPVWSSNIDGRNALIPLSIALPQSRTQEFVNAGFVLLSSYANDNKACILGAPVVYRAKKYTTKEETEQAQLSATLPYQMFATRIAHYLRRISQEVSTGLTADQVQRNIESKLRLALAKSGTVTVQVSESRENSDYYDVSLRISPSFQILGRNVKLVLGLQLHR